ncbi:MAG TPA: winged helix-turn-helix transcriptional regulator, partial [Candidatus Thermoplasmatota archaeon]|nr:winged helix-turn-helix transcriptional regulator [Candidatus Thermoplasmatota archaeon]
PRAAAGVAGGAGLLAGLAWAAKRLGLFAFLPLYTRLAKSEMLDNQARASVYAHVRANPGAHPSAIAQALGLGWGTVVYHLSRLEQSSLVTARSARHRKCYFAVGGDLSAPEREAVAALCTDKAKVIVSAVRDAPGISQKDLAHRLGMSQALASFHVKKLVASGVLRTAKAGRSHALTVAEHVPAIAMAA